MIAPRYSNSVDRDSVTSESSTDSYGKWGVDSAFKNGFQKSLLLKQLRTKTFDLSIGVAN